MKRKNESSRRSRGTRLSRKGMKNLVEAKRKLEDQKNNGLKYTLEALSELTGLTSRTIARVFSGRDNVDRKTIFILFSACELEVNDDDLIIEDEKVFEDKRIKVERNLCDKEDWMEKVSASNFYGRANELSTLDRWVVSERCRLVAITGLSGMGKTALLSSLAKHIHKDFEYIFWQSMQNNLCIYSLFKDVIQKIEEGSISSKDTEMSKFIHCLKKHRCLLLLDSVEKNKCIDNNNTTTELCSGHERYYSDMLKEVGEAAHQSCMVLATREKPREVALLEGNNLPVRSYRLCGLNKNDARKLLEEKSITASEVEVEKLMGIYSGNPSSIKAVSTTIRDVFNGNVSSFLSQNINMFGDVRISFDEQFQMLSDLEKEIIGWLAVKRKPCSFLELTDIPSSPVRKSKLLERLESLTRKSFIEVSSGFFSLPSIVLEYANTYLSERIFQEIITKSPCILKHYELLDSSSNRNGSQCTHSNIINLVADCLLANTKSKSDIEKLLSDFLLKIVEQKESVRDYTMANITSLSKIVARKR